MKFLRMERQDSGLERVIVVGGGASGMAAALSASDSGRKVFLLEKNEKLGKKLYITGKGRCNVTNAADMETMFDSVCTNAKFLYSAFYGYDNRAVMEFLENAGCPLKTERGDRVFPRSDHASDVTAAFQRELKKRGVDVRLGTEVSGLCVKEGRVTGVRLTKGSVLEGERVILCTGGLSYPATGSTGDGYRFAEETGHRLVERRPALVPFNIAEEWCGRLTGLSLRNISLVMTNGKKNLYEGFGEMLFTHFGVSGPVVLSASAHLRSGYPVTLRLDMKPALDEKTLDLRLQREFAAHGNRDLRNCMGSLLPAKMILPFLSRLGFTGEEKPHSLLREERRRLCVGLKDLRIELTGPRPLAEAIVTSGGVSVDEVDPKTMASRLVSGLYFAGELLDVDAYTGGYNLQIAFATGRLAGLSAARAT